MGDAILQAGVPDKRRKGAEHCVYHSLLAVGTVSFPALFWLWVQCRSPLYSDCGYSVTSAIKLLLPAATMVAWVLKQRAKFNPTPLICFL